MAVVAVAPSSAALVNRSSRSKNLMGLQAHQVAIHRRSLKPRSTKRLERGFFLTMQRYLPKLIGGGGWLEVEAQDVTGGKHGRILIQNQRCPRRFIHVAQLHMVLAARHRLQDRG